MIHAGEATNVIPDSCELQGTVRTFSIELLDRIERRMWKWPTIQRLLTARVVSLSLQGNYPPTINSAREAEFARKVMVGIVGADHVTAQEPTMGAEDFSLYVDGQARLLQLHRQWRWCPPRDGPWRRPCCCTTPAMTSTGHIDSSGRYLLGAPGGILAGWRSSMTT